MPAPAYVGAGAIAQGRGALTVTWPAGHRPRDLALLILQGSGQDDNADVNGWSQVSGSPLVDVASNSGSKFQLLWKRASSSSEPAVALPDLGDHTIACIALFRGGPPGGTPFSAVTTAIKTSGSGTTTLPALTTAVPDTLVVGLASRPNDSANESFSLSNPALTAFSEHLDTGTTHGNGGGFGMWSGIREVPGAVAGSSGSQNPSTTNCCFSLAIPPDRRVSRCG
jgi:hypothetical protein